MSVARRLFRHSGSSHSRKTLAARARKTFRALGVTACALAIFFSAGGQWAVLQSVAYTRMLLEFAQTDSLGTAVRKAFDGKHSCSLCPKIRDGYNKQRQAPRTATGERLPEFVGQASGRLVFTLTRGLDIPVSIPSYKNFCTAPPEPPPRIG